MSFYRCLLCSKMHLNQSQVDIYEQPKPRHKQVFKKRFILIVHPNKYHVMVKKSKIHLILIVPSYIKIDCFLEIQTITSNYLLRYKSKLMRSELIIIPLIIIPMNVLIILMLKIIKERTAIHNRSFHAVNVTKYEFTDITCFTV